MKQEYYTSQNDIYKDCMNVNPIAKLMCSQTKTVSRRAEKKRKELFESSTIEGETLDAPISESEMFNNARTK